MKNKKNKYGFIVLVEVLVVLLFILKLHNNLDECRAIDDAPYYWLIFDYTGKPNLPEMIIVTKPGILGTKSYLQKQIMNLRTMHLKRNQKQVEL